TAQEAARAEAASRKKDTTSAKPSAAKSTSKPTKRKRTFPYRKVEDIEADIASAETELRRLEEALASSDLYRDGDKVKETTKAFEDIKVRIAQLYEHWEEAVELN